MALNCRIIRGADGSIDHIITEGGTRSALFDSLVRVSNKEVALDLYALTETEEFKELRPSKSGEPSVKEVLTYAAQRNSNLDDQQVRDVENTIVGSGLRNYGELLNVLKKIFLKRGVIVFDRNSMQNSGFYNKFEVESILSDVNLQERIKSTIIGLTNSAVNSIPSYNQLFVVSNTSRLNSLGKQEVSNPYVTEQQITEEIAGTDITDSIDTISFEAIKNKYYSDPEVKGTLRRIASKSKIIGEKEIVDGILTDKSTNRVKETLVEVLDLEDRVVLSSKVDYLNTILPGVWDISTNAVYSLLKDLKISAINSGVDFLTLEDSVYTKNREEILNLLQSYQDVLNTPTDATLNAFVENYSNFFQIASNNATRVAETDDSSDVYIDSNISEYEAFTKFGLIKKSENIYKQVDVIDDLDEVYSVMATNTDLLPAAVSNEEELRDYIQSRLSDTDISDFQVDSDQLQKMLLYKLFFSSPVQFNSPPVIRDNYLQFKGDYSYLTQEYPSDFYKQWLREKNKNSELFKNFYSNFVVTKNGIELVNSDPITVQNVMRYATDELKEYNLLSKRLNLPIDQADEDVIDFNEMIYNRQQAISNPESIGKLTKPYTVISPITLAVKNETTNFVRTPIGVYEIDYQIGNVSFYNLLPTSDSRYNSIGQYRTKTQSDVNLDEYRYLQDTPEAFTEAQNYYSSAELSRINKKYFGCL